MTVGLPDPVPEIVDADLLPAGRPTAAFIDLGAIQENFRALRSFAGSGRDVLAVVKAEAYGHGGAEAASAFVEAGAGWLGVATMEEGEALRIGAGIPAGTRILVMSGAYPDLAPRLVAADLDAVVWDAAQTEALAAAGAAAGRPARIHVKVDSGMRRLGIAPGEAADFLRRAQAMPGLEVAGLMSHLAQADEEDGEEPTRAQLEIIGSLIESLGDLLPPMIHCANSAGGLMYPDAPGGLVRAGIALYGAPPAHAKSIGLRPAMTLKSAIVQLREVSAGEAIGYGGTYRRSSAGRIAVVPIGYADGYPRILSNRAEALVRGRRVPVAGRVSMDMLTLDVSGLAGAVARDEVVLIGVQGDEAVPCEELAGRAHTISYEILSRIGLRVPRVFFRGGRIAGSRMLGGAPH